ncbi:MAG: hypothetical protein E8D51_04555 [Nitrospira sp.]|nr:MAG: hypothetical protein E8D51_04555 [Nitrospira sp.]
MTPRCDSLWRMKSCAQCQQQNQEDAKFCYQCGNSLAIEPAPPIAAAAFASFSNWVSRGL